MFINAHQGIFTVNAWKSLPHNSDISVILILAFIDCLLSIWDLSDSWYDKSFFTETWVLYYSMKFSVLFKLSLLADVLWYHLSRGRENSALLLAGGNRSPGLLLGLHWLLLPQEGGAAHYCWVEILAPNWTFTDTSLTGRGGSGLLWLPTWLVAILWQRMVLLLLDGDESPDSLPSLLLYHLHKEGEGCLVATRWW